MVDGWEVVERYPGDPAAGGNAVVDLSHQSVFELNGPRTEGGLRELCSEDVPVRTIRAVGTATVYRLTQTRALVFGGAMPPGALDVTGGWASLALVGPQAAAILAKITAVDLRPRTLAVGTCCEGPVFGVVTLFGRREDHFDLHVAADAAEFFWEVLLDAGSEFGLRPAGLEFWNRYRG
jgi:sarcosine oxidase subunit alpha